MRRLKWVVSVALICGAPLLNAQTYKCKGQEGQTTFQQTPCSESGNREENAQEANRTIESACATLTASDTEYSRCAAEIECDKAGAVGPTRSECIRMKRQEQERVPATQRAPADERAAAIERAKQQQEAADRAATKAAEEAQQEKPLDCDDLSLRAKAQGHNASEGAMIVDDAKKSGRCVDNPP